MTGRRVRTASRLKRADRLVRDREIAQRYLAGEPPARLGEAFGLTQGGVNRLLARISEQWRLARKDALIASIEPAPQRSARAAGGRPSIWPDCPPHLSDEYRRIRAVIGSAAAKQQLLALAARDAAEGKAQ